MHTETPAHRGVRSLLTLAGAAATIGLSAQTATPPAAAPAAPASEEEVVVLSPFEVTAESDTGYVATDTLAGTRIRSDLKDIGSAISVVTKDLMNDIGATDATTLLQYTTNTEVAGTRGVFSGMNGASTEQGAILNPVSAQRTRGLDAADNTRDYFVSDIPWDSYNTDRIDILRGPNSFLFGLGSPAGIQNAGLQNAIFTNRGTVEYRIASYGSQRADLNVNHVLIDDVLSIRIAGLMDHENFRQEPAFENDNRVYAALRWDPKLIKNPAFHTSFKVKYEAGDIKANRPRNITPLDQITAWFRPVDNTSATGGMGKLLIASPYYPSRTDLAEGGQSVSGNKNFNPWLSDTMNAQQPYWTFDGASGTNYAVIGGWINSNAYGSNGKLTGVSNGVPGKYYSGNLYSVAAYTTRATTTGYGFVNSQYGVYRNQGLTDSSIFDFYNNLIDGPNKSEFQRWTAYNVDFSQTGWDDRVGINLTYDRQQNLRGGESLLGWAPAINIDINENNQDFYLGSAAAQGFNENVGRAFVVGAANSGSGTSTRTDRETKRASLFGELRVSDLTDNAFLVKLLGKHRFNGVASSETYTYETRSWQMYANNQLWAGYWNQNSGSSSAFNDRPPMAIIYLGDSLLGLDSASGANIPRIKSKIELQDSGLYIFDPMPKVDVSTFSNSFTVPDYLANVVGGSNLTQAANLGNLTGWTYWSGDQLMRADGGENTDLLTGLQRAIKKTTSYSGSYQGFFWNNAFIVTLGWRFDSIKSKDDTATQQATNRNILNLNTSQTIADESNDPNFYLPDYWEAYNKGHSTSTSYALHLNKLLKKDPLPLNVSLSYAKSSNYQVGNIRRDMYGTTLDNPSGTTKEYGITLGTKDNKYSLRVLKFETSVTGSSVSLDSLGSIISNGLNWRNVFLYQLGGYDYASRGQDSYRNRWTNAYPAFIQDASGKQYADGTAEYNAGVAASMVEMNKAITGWNDIQKWLDAKGFFQQWNFNPTGPSAALVDRATYLTDTTKYAPSTATVYSYTPTAPQGYTVTSDTVSKGYEFEFTANPTASWRVTFNAAKTDAVRNNVGGQTLDEFVTYMDSMMYNADGTLTPAGKVPRWGGAANSIGASVYGPWRAAYTKLKLQEGTTADEVRKWRFNVITNYSFHEGFLKGAGVGAAYRWMDRVVIGYPVLAGGTYDLSKPYYGPSEDAFDLWLSYTHKLTAKIDWKIQLNVRNVFANNKVIPISVQPDGETWGMVRIAPAREWMLTNTFTF
jgi:outer membrane receptor protein involved in Fe transport